MNDHFFQNSTDVKILLVDDSPTDRQIFRRLIGRADKFSFEFIETETIAKALEVIEKDRPDCVLLDFSLPDGSGTDLILKINERYGKNSIPIVMLSGSSSIENAVEAMRLGAQDFLVKNDATSADLIRAVSNAVDKVALHGEKKQAAKKIRVSEERYRLLFENTPLTAIVFDLEHGLILAVNDFAVTRYGYTEEEFLEMRINDLYAPGVVSSEIEDENFCDENESVSISSRHRKKDGTVIDVEINCHDITFKGRRARFALIQDVTEREKTYNQLRASEQFNRTVIESSPDCVKLLDGDGRLTFMNQNGLCLMEIERFEDVRGREWSGFWDDETRREVEESLETARHGEVGRFEGFCHTFNGTPKWWDVIVAPIFDSRGRVERILSVSRDITASKQIEKEREESLRREKELRAQAESANRAKDEFLAVLSHELRSPLNAMSGWARMLQAGTLDAEKAKKAIDVIDRNINLQNNLIEDLLDISRFISGKIKIEPADIDFCRVVSDAVETVRPAAETKNISITFDSAAENCELYGDRNRLQQVVGNLLTNAIKFTPENRDVRVSLESDEEIVRLRVADAGIGIEEDLLPHIFDRFRQADGSTKRNYGGLGLGLAIVKTLVEMHGGRVSAASEGRDRGSTFTVEIPLRGAAAASETEADETAASAGSAASQNGSAAAEKEVLGDLRILIVDDERDSLELLSFILKTKGAETFCCASAGEALETIEKVNPDLLISDISMAEMDGYDLIRRVRESPSGRNRSIPAIALTAYTSAEDRDEVLSAGFQMHITKPIDVEEVPLKIRELLDSIRN